MSYRNKPRPSSKAVSIAWPFIVFGIILLAAAVFLLTRPEASDGTPRLAVDTQRIEYGYVKFGETRAFEIKVTNTGDGVLRFTKKPDIEILEGC